MIFNNQNEFIQVSRVKARHITLANQQDADNVYQQLQQGMKFSEAIKLYSIAPDKADNPSGQLGLINKNSKNLTFRQKLALIQPVDKASTPYRMLDGNSYEILIVDEKSPEFLPLTDKSVRASIVNKLARLKAATHLEKVKNRLVILSDVKINTMHYKGVRW